MPVANKCICAVFGGHSAMVGCAEKRNRSLRLRDYVIPWGDTLRRCVEIRNGSADGDLHWFPRRMGIAHDGFSTTQLPTMDCSRRHFMTSISWNVQGSSWKRKVLLAITRCFVQVQGSSWNSSSRKYIGLLQVPGFCWRYKAFLERTSVVLKAHGSSAR